MWFKTTGQQKMARERAAVTRMEEAKILKRERDIFLWLHSQKDVKFLSLRT